LEAELYDLEHDPGELTNLAAMEPGRTSRMVRRLAVDQIRSRPGQTVEDTVKDQLRTLGYFVD